MDPSQAPDRVTFGSAAFSNRSLQPEPAGRSTWKVPRRWRSAARVAWVVLAASAFVLFFASLPAYYDQLGTTCVGGSCADWRLTPDGVQALQKIGLSTSFYAAYMTTLDVVFAGVWWAAGIVVFWRKSDESMALLTSAMLLILGAGFRGSPEALTPVHPAWQPPAEGLAMLGFTSAIVFLYTFPDGRFIPRWSVWLALVWAASDDLSFLAPPLVHGSWFGPLGVLGFVLFLVPAIGSVAVQIYRYRRVSTAAQRQQTKWALFGIVAGFGGFLCVSLLQSASPALRQSGSLGSLVIEAISTGLLLIMPLSLAFAVLRSRLWDIDPVINRVLVYGTLTACVVGIYILVVGGSGALLEDGSNLLVSLLSTGLVAIIFTPLRGRLQRAVNHLMYGERDDPYGVVSRLGRRLEATLAPEAVLPAIVENVARALRLPRAGIWLADGETLRLEAAHGSAPADTTVRDAGAVEALRCAPDGLGPGDLSPGGYRDTLFASGTALVLPLTHRGEFVGALSLAPRGPEEEFSPADRRLLRDLATQSGAAVHAVRLTGALRSSLEELRRSRERLISAQEEERRRIQRDLHDGLGPTLASMRLRLEACLDAAQETEAPLVGDLERLYELIGQATGDIRRLVYDLRPPVLDQLGLVPALRQHCERFGRETGIEVGFEVETGLFIPAAAEVTLLRVVQEALVNVQKHAQASRAEVRLGQRDEWLMLEIRDDGIGFIADGHDIRAGTGTGSMSERAELLGGTLQLTGRPGAGTEVVVRVPNQEVTR